MGFKKYHRYQISFLGETMTMRSDVSQDTLEKLNDLVEKAIFDINNGNISGNSKVETLILTALKLASNQIETEQRIETKIDEITKKLEKFSH